MASFNQVILVGNMTRDPELRYTPGGAAVCEFGMAMNRKYKQGEETKEEVCFVDVTVWGRMGETVSQYKKKGDQILVSGYLKLDTWEKDGQQRSKLKVVGLNCTFLGGGGGGGQGGGGNSGGGGGGYQQNQGGGQSRGGQGGGSVSRGGSGGQPPVSRGGEQPPAQQPPPQQQKQDDDLDLNDIPF